MLCNTDFNESANAKYIVHYVLDTEWNLMSEQILVNYDNHIANTRILNFQITGDELVFSFYAADEGKVKIYDDHEFIPPPEETLYLCKVNYKTHNFLWKRSFASADWHNFLIEMSDDDIIIATTYVDYLKSDDFELDHGRKNMWYGACISLDENGTANWVKSINSWSGLNSISDLKVYDSKVYLTGCLYYGIVEFDGLIDTATQEDPFVLILNQDGVASKFKTYKYVESGQRMQRIGRGHDGRLYLYGDFTGSYLLYRDTHYHSGLYYQRPQHYLFELNEELDVIQGDVFVGSNRHYGNFLGDMLVSDAGIYMSTSVSCELLIDTILYTDNCEYVDVGSVLLFNGQLEKTDDGPFNVQTVIDLDIRVLMEGAMNKASVGTHDLMHNKLFERGYLPGQIPKTLFGEQTEQGQPYFTEPWNYPGDEGVDFSNFEYPESAVDWILVSVLSELNRDSIVAKSAGLLLSDGQVIFPNAFVPGPSVANMDYYVLIEHRNHLPVMTPFPIPVSDKKLTYDFTLNDSYSVLFGSGQKRLENSMYAMFAGNGDQNSIKESLSDINLTDLLNWYHQNGLNSKYLNLDFDLNGDVNVKDKALLMGNIGVFSDVPK